jgi:hypothetical protein
VTASWLTAVARSLQLSRVQETVALRRLFARTASPARTEMFGRSGDSRTPPYRSSDANFVRLPSERAASRRPLPAACVMRESTVLRARQIFPISLYVVEERRGRHTSADLSQHNIRCNYRWNFVAYLSTQVVVSSSASRPATAFILGVNFARSTLCDGSTRPCSMRCP